MHALPNSVTTLRLAALSALLGIVGGCTSQPPSVGQQKSAAPASSSVTQTVAASHTPDTVVPSPEADASASIPEKVEAEDVSPQMQTDPSEPVDKPSTPPESQSTSITETKPENDETANTTEPSAKQAKDPKKAAAQEDPILEGWKKPQFALFLSGQQHGYIEPCGCTGLANQKGGLMRRHTLLKQLQDDRDWGVVSLDVGNQVRRFGRQAEIKLGTTAQGLRKMGYEAISFGPDDLRLSIDEVFSAVASEDPEDIRYLAANASILGFTPGFRIVERGGKRIGVTGVLGKKEQARISNDEVEMSDPVTALKQAKAQLEAENCDFYVLLSHASLEESRQYAQEVPGFQIVVTAGGAGEPTREPEKIPDSDSLMIQVGTKGMYVGVVGIYDDAEQPIRYERIALDARFADSDEMFKLLASYQKQLEGLGLDGLGIRPQAHPSGRHYVGGETCGECHTEAYAIWEDSRHSHALDTLIHPPERYQVSRHYDPECLACHVTGWNPGLYLPYQSGYLSLENTPKMADVSCENCHGPGSEHVKAEYGEGDFTDEQMTALRQEMVLPLDKARETCLQCHDLDNSPDFHAKGAFEEYWEKVAHYGLD